MEPTFQRFVHDRILNSTRGAKGGLTLGRSGQEITLAEICRSVAQANPADHVIAPEVPLSEMSKKIIRPLFLDLEQRLLSELALVTVQDLVARARTLQEAPALREVEPEPKGPQGRRHPTRSKFGSEQ
jgi:DNA-binding IscR family transcriptional regulator